MDELGYAIRFLLRKNIQIMDCQWKVCTKKSEDGNSNREPDLRRNIHYDPWGFVLIRNQWCEPNFM